MRPYISEELLTFGKISMGMPKYLKEKQEDVNWCYDHQPDSQSGERLLLSLLKNC